MPDHRGAQPDQPDSAAATAPGRINLIGEHTDYHDGFVLPTVLPQTTQTWARRRPGHEVLASSSAFPGETAQYPLGQEQLSGRWSDYVQGVTWVLSRSGAELGGFEVAVTSSIPVGAGVSSSAALVVSLLRVLRTLFALPLDDIAIARLAQQVETDFVGAPVGIMDQMACSVGRPAEALFLDTRSLAFERIVLPASAELLVIDSGTTHRHAAGHYAQRRQESFEAATLLGVARLRDLSVADLPHLAALPPLLARRARHVVTENQRVVDAAAALRQHDFERLGTLFDRSHASMRDDYQISTADIDRLVGLARSHPAVYGARLTGGGFGGAVVALTREGRSLEVARAVMASYGDGGGPQAAVLVPTLSAP